MTLWFTVGVPGSGKTTYAERVHQDGRAKVLSRDEVRDQFGAYSNHKERHVMEICKHSIQGWLVNGEEVLFDSTALDARSRLRIVWWAKELFALGEVQKEVEVGCLFFPCKIADSIARRKDKIPEDRLREMHKQLRKPQMTEGMLVWEITDPFNAKLLHDLERYFRNDGQPVEPLKEGADAAAG